MIREIRNRSNALLLTSDRWHVLRARWTGGSTTDPRYVRTIESEHADRTSAERAARAMAAAFQTEMAGRAREARDQVLVRRPGYRSLRRAARTRPRRA